VFPDPGDVGIERLGKEIRARLEPGVVLKEYEVEFGERIRQRFAVHAAANDRRKALVERGGERHFFQRYLGGSRIRTQHKHNGLGARDQRLDADPPLLKGVDFGAIDERLETAHLQRRLEAVDKRHVLAGVRDENLRPRWFSALPPSSVTCHGTGRGSEVA
jgi:hypothetical protein